MHTFPSARPAREAGGDGADPRQSLRLSSLFDDCSSFSKTLAQISERPSTEALKLETTKPEPIPIKAESKSRKPSSDPWRYIRSLCCMLSFCRTAPSTFLEPQQGQAKPIKKMIKLPSDYLAKLNLKDGKNMIEFSIVTKLQGKATVGISCCLFS